MLFRSLFGRRRPERLAVTIDSGSGPTVVLVHGIAASSKTFSELVPLISTGRRIVAIDLLGFGASPSPRSSRFTIADHTAALTQTLDSARIREPFILVGHSLGALIAARFAAQNPDRVRGLVVVSPPVYIPVDSLPSGRNRSAMLAYERVFDFLRANKRFTMATARWLTRVLPIPHVLELSDTTWRAFSLSLQNAIQSQTTFIDIAATRAPVRVVYGTLDAVVAPVAMELLANLRNVSVHPVPGGDHMIHGALARQVSACIDGLQNGSTGPRLSRGPEDARSK